MGVEAEFIGMADKLPFVDLRILSRDEITRWKIRDASASIIRLWNNEKNSEPDVADGRSAQEPKRSYRNI